MSILQNAIDSIQIGLEDYQSPDNRRHISAIRNIFAGVLLLYKEKLRQLSPARDPDLFIKAKIEPKIINGKITLEGKGKKTVDVQSIKERFKNFQIKIDEKRLGEINDLRNDIEHYFSSKSPDAVREVIAKSFLLIRDFIKDEIDEEPREIIGDNYWSLLLNTAEVYEAEAAACIESLQEIDWQYQTIKSSLEELRCPQCHSSLIKAEDLTDIYPAINLTCASCGYNFSFEDIAESFIGEILGAEAYISIKDGGDSPYDTCPECGKDTFIYEEECCIACDYKIEHENCWRCGASLSLDEQELDGLCGYCGYVLSKESKDD